MEKMTESNTSEVRKYYYAPVYWAEEIVRGTPGVYAWGNEYATYNYSMDLLLDGKYFQKNYMQGSISVGDEKHEKTYSYPITDITNFLYYWGIDIYGSHSFKTVTEAQKVGSFTGTTTSSAVLDFEIVAPGIVLSLKDKGVKADMSVANISLNGETYDSLIVLEDGTAQYISVLKGSSMTVLDKGEAYAIGVNGQLNVSSGGVAKDVTINNGGYITVEDDALLKGSIDLTGTMYTDSGVVNKDSNCNITINVENSEEYGYISDLSYFSADQCNIMVSLSAAIKSGMYTIAKKSSPGIDGKKISLSFEDMAIETFALNERYFYTVGNTVKESVNSSVLTGFTTDSKAVTLFWKNSSELVVSVAEDVCFLGKLISVKDVQNFSGTIYDIDKKWDKESSSGTLLKTKDAMHCWLATAVDMLGIAGYCENSEDLNEIFRRKSEEIYSASQESRGGGINSAIVHLLRDMNIDFKQVYKEESTIGFNFDDIYDIRDAQNNAMSAWGGGFFSKMTFAEIEKRMMNGDAIGLGIRTLSSPDKDGHAITLYGFAYDNEKNVIGIYVTDSDDIAYNEKNDIEYIPVCFDENSGRWLLGNSSNGVGYGAVGYFLAWYNYLPKNSQALSDPTGPSLTKDLSVSVTNKSYKAKFSWGKADLEKGEKLQGYEIVLDGVSLGYVKSTSYSPKSPLSVGTHNFKVRAVNESGKAGAWYEESFVLQDVTAPEGKMKINAAFSMDGSGVPVVDLSWEPATDNVGVTKYIVSYGSGKEMVSTETTGTSLRISNVAGKMTFQVSACDAAGNQSKVSKITTTVPDLVAPDVVQNLRSELDSKKYKATLSWDAALDNGGTAKAAGYYVTYAKNADFSDGITKKSTKTSLAVSDLEANTTYYYKVTAYDKAGNESGDSQVSSFYVKDLTAPSGKMKVTAEAKVENGQQVVDLSWNAAEDNIGVTKYLVEYGSGKNLISYETTSTHFRLPGTVAGKLTVQIRAYDAAGNESKISKSNVTIADKIAPDVVRNLSCVQDESKYKATLTWDESLDNGGTAKATGYYVTYATNADFSDGVTKKTTKATLSLSKLQANTTYYYKVTAYDKAKNESASSEVYSFYVKDVTPPSKPSMQVKEVSDHVYLVSWKTPKDNVGIAGYEVECLNASGEVLQSWNTADATVSLTLPSAGDYTIRLCAYDTSGNVSPDVEKKIKVKSDLALTYSSAADLNLSFGSETERSLGLAAV